MPPSTPAETDSEEKGLKSYPWDTSYGASHAEPDAPPVDMLHDFYIPALRRSVRYDRMAGYFRSSALAVASRGFSAFVGKKGNMRLIAGADLDPEDAKVLLELGRSAKLEETLLAELREREGWPAEVTRGVDLLAYMVAHGYLEVRVAFHVHRETGAPLELTDDQDGYVHDKWLIFYDEFGNRLYANGSLNESKTALTKNAESMEVFRDWTGESDAARTAKAVRAFENAWNGKNKYLIVLPLPQAVERELIQIGERVVTPVEIDGSSAAPKTAPPPSPKEWLKFAILRDAPRMPGGRFVGMYTAPVQPWPHQEVVARRLIETWPYSYLLCDEVGLGKTIEAGLAIRSLWLSGAARRVLVAAPASLTRQWQREMATKFLLPFARARTGTQPRHEIRHPEERTRAADSIYDPDLLIVSTGLLARKKRKALLQQAEPFDIALVDEAHYARRQNPGDGEKGKPRFGQLYRAMEDPLRAKARALWLATATPMQIDAVEACDLIRLVNRTGAFQFDPTLTLEYYRCLQPLLNGNDIDSGRWEFLRGAVGAIQREDPFLWAHIQHAVVDARIRSTSRRWLERGQPPRRADLRNMPRLLFAAAPLSRVMLRHTRSLLKIYRENGQLGANLAERRIRPIPPIAFTPRERAAYDDLQTYCDDLRERIGAAGGSKRTNLQFYLSGLRLRLASSMYAIQKTLERRRKKVDDTLRFLQPPEETEDFDLETEYLESEAEDDAQVVGAALRDRSPADLEWERDRLDHMLERYAETGERPSKIQALLDALHERRTGVPGRYRQTVLFTRFFDTLEHIEQTLRHAEPNIRLGTYSGRGGRFMDVRAGRMRGVERDEIKHRFLRGEIDVLLCTDAAAEGLNLQTADLLVNFDLPWNPMKVEQRIGRIDRIGQSHERIEVLNLAYPESVEQFVYERLLQRLAETQAVVGSQQVSMLPVRVEEFEQLAEGTLTPEALEREVLQRLRRQKERSARMEIPARDLYDIYLKMSQQAREVPLPADMDAISRTLLESAYLANLGGRVEESGEASFLRMEGFPDLRPDTLLTASRALFENPPEEMERRLHFATYGCRVFDAILARLREFPEPSCVRRIAVADGAAGRRMVAYLAAERQPDGTPAPRLITRWIEADELELAEEAELRPEDVSAAEARLRRIAKKEWEDANAAAQIEARNIDAGRAQETLNLLVARCLLEFYRPEDVDGDKFSSVFRRLRETAYEEENGSLQPIPANPLRPIQGKTPFAMSVPEFNDQASVTAPAPLITAALDSLERLVHRIKKKKSELTTADVIGRIERELGGR